MYGDSIATDLWCWPWGLTLRLTKVEEKQGDEAKSTRKTTYKGVQQQQQQQQRQQQQKQNQEQQQQQQQQQQQ